MISPNHKLRIIVTGMVGTYPLGGGAWYAPLNYNAKFNGPVRMRNALAKVKAQHLPIGSGTIESTVRRVVNLRLKGASLFWLESHAEDMLLLRAYYKAKHWQVLENKVFAPLTTLVA